MAVQQRAGPPLFINPRRNDMAKEVGKTIRKHADKHTKPPFKKPAIPKKSVPSKGLPSKGTPTKK